MEVGKITIAGLGPGSKEHLTLGVVEAIKNHNNLYLRTEKHPTVDYLVKEGINYKSFDDVYNQHESFDEVYQHICQYLLREAADRDILYLVPGHPYVAEYTVDLLVNQVKEKNIEIDVIPAMSFLDVLLPIVGLDPVAGFKLLDALQLDHQEPDPLVANIITQMYDSYVASEVKLKLMEYYDYQQEVFVIRAAAVPQLERVERLPLYQLDRVDWVDYLTSLYIPRIDSNQKRFYNMNNLIDIMERLRHKDGCPWDIQQTHETLKPYLVEEAYEVLEAIDLEDDLLLEEELGDLLLQVVFHSQIAKERGAFNIKDVIRGICEKLVYRHPHVFLDVKVEDSEGALDSWEEQKRQEKHIKSHTESMISIPKELPALMRADKIQRKAAKVGFDWDNPQDVINKIHEELQELLEAQEKGNPVEIKEEGGDLLFAVVNLLRFYKVEPEDALRSTINKFLKRFSYIEDKAKKMEQKLENMSLAEMDLLWEESKKNNTIAPKC
ncbi:bifunctional methyltransferase/pyrophosphohydrolase YabN [Alkaliphilus serpentinus]|uniref:Nucleoside triphosphate pyrophosphohydrolase n=1 Tax=Alkaliphilus serpentinus TaxID=1482731 RepID=A0A833M8X6_9FIRM|nr:nucleoside triphosphate pyrophosphohydrolase [Alkaliphilus serpentinus]KAB3531851.1 nucleoside triphosphate pyrophosphohydrolase [Alkaliphilus serpentinus]